MKGRELTLEELAIQTCNSNHHNATINAEISRGHFEAQCIETTPNGASAMDYNGEENTQKPKDYTVFLAALTAFIAFFNILMILLFNAPFKRSIANKDEPKDT